MRRALVLGGSRFIGRHLVDRLLAEGTAVTIATRGRTRDPFGEAVRRLVVDRSDAGALVAAVRGQDWDLCFDQVCFDGPSARAAIQALAGRVGRVVLTSSATVYPFGDGTRVESDFDAAAHPASSLPARTLGYEEGKRQAETAWSSAPGVRLVAVRLPMILGDDDPTGKLSELAALRRAGRPLPVANPDCPTSWLGVDEAARFLTWAASSALEGPVNACSDEAASLRTMVGWLDAELGTKGALDDGPMRPGLVRIALPGALVMSNAKARAAGWSFAPLAAWLPPLLRALR